MATKVKILVAIINMQAATDTIDGHELLEMFKIKHRQIRNQNCVLPPEQHRNLKEKLDRATAKKPSRDDIGTPPGNNTRSFIFTFYPDVTLKEVRHTFINLVALSSVIS